MQQLDLDFRWPVGGARQADPLWLKLGPRYVRLWLVPNRRAKRYVLRLLPNGSARVTVPRRGSAAQARRFAESNIGWVEKQLLRQALEPSRPTGWFLGAEILYRGDLVRLEPGNNGEQRTIRLGAESLCVANPAGDLRPAIQRYLWRLAARELPARVCELAALHRIPVRRVTVRNQRSRWGSCSRRGTVSLNWRLVQAPPLVRDYIILHELAHFQHMNHSRRFWREVARLCPDWRQAEAWLKSHSSLLRA